MPDMPMSYFFFDKQYYEQYSGEERFGKLFIGFSGLAIFISCLGLLGLSAFTIARRTKEIGVRKVLGASVASVLNLLTREFIIMIVIAFAIGVPIAWLTMSQWLETFVYRTDITIWIVAFAGILALTVSIGTVSIIAIKAATVNPVESLRSE